MVNTAYGQLTGTHQPSVLNKVQSTSLYNEISSTGAVNLKGRISFPKLVQMINNRGPISKVQKEARVLRKRKAAEISEEEVQEAAVAPAVPKKAPSKAAKAIIAKRSKAKVARGEVLNRPKRKGTNKTAKAGPSNTK